VKNAVISSEKLELDYQAFIKKVEQTAAADKEKVRFDLEVLRGQAAKYEASA
jgi:hypothetical protein